MPVLPSLRLPAQLLLLAMLLPFPAAAQEAEAIPVPIPSPAVLTLDAAIEEAFARSPALAKARAEVDEARGRLVVARTFPYNPEIEIGVADRQGIGESSTDRGAALTQQLEIGGQRKQRVRASELELESLEASFRRLQQLLAASVAMAFAEAVGVADLADLATAETELARELLGVTRRRFEAGAATQMELNLARASAARSQRRTEVARASSREARSILAEAVGLDPAAPPDSLAKLALPAGEPAPLAELVRGAMERRADLRALAQARLAAEARLLLTKAQRVPDLSIGAFYEEEEGTDRILGAGFEISIPIFNRNRGEITEARAAIERAAAEAASLDLAVRREVYSALAQYEAARSSAQQLGEEVVGSLTDSLELLERSFAAGKIGLSDLLVFRSELIEARREQIEATADAWAARIALDLAVGGLPIPMRDALDDAAEVPPTDSSSEINR